MGRETDELHFERQLYDYLANLGGSKQWQQMDNLKTTDDLWGNFRQIVYRLNQDKLIRPLSNPEFNQVKKQLLDQTKTPYHAGVFLYGVNGKSQVEIDRDDGQHVFLTLFDQDQIGAGDTIYQVANQIELKNKLPGKKHRRFDTTLLINGLPIIQIEEKADGHNAKEALNQMHQYQAERQYTDIFSTVQILVALTPHDARYMANTTTDNFNDAFAFQWKKNGKKQPPILDWREFADQFLSIPMAHKMATNYMILDNTSNHQMIKVMRYYQVYATQTIIEKLAHHDFAYSNDKSQKVGYIWHTTGSGKTISSFKTAFLASRLPNVDKVVFLVDRVALTNQTVDEYQAYDPNSDDDNQDGIVMNTANIFDLKRKLLSKQKTTIIVTSTQKMDKLVKNGRFKMNDQRVVFIVDEAHRSTGGEMIVDIKKAFPKSAWIGYTGTPNFKATKQNPTTASIFGPPLHRYVISDAIADHNVLGFQVDFKTTIPRKELETKYLPQYFKIQNPQWTDAEIRHRIEKLSPEDMDDNVSPSVYDMQPQHVQQVVTDILKHWEDRSVHGRYNALFTTHVGGNQASIPMAMMYFDEFQRQIKAHGPELKIAVTFSQDTSNGDHQLETNQGLSRAMDYYNELFNTHFSDQNIDEYSSNLISRLNRTASDGNYLDIVIVVNQLLTGFDAPQLNTLYVDRTLKGAGLIQAYSRTNRIQNMTYKQDGRIINYRWPANSEKLMRQALAIYSNPDSADVNTKLKIPDNVLAKSYQATLLDLRATVANLADLTDQFQMASPSESKREETYVQLIKYNQQMAKIKQYDEFDHEHPERLLNAIGLNEDQESRLTGPIADDIKQYIAKSRDTDEINLNLHMEQVKEVKVNYDYLHELIAEYANRLNDQQADQTEIEKLKAKIYQILNSLDEKDKKYADEVRSLMESDLKAVAKSFPIQPEQIDRLVHQHSSNWSDEQLRAFVHQWGLTHYQDQQGIKQLIQQHQVGNTDDLKRSNFLDRLVRFGQQHYQRDASIDVQKLSKLKYHNQLNKAFQKIADRIKKRI